MPPPRAVLVIQRKIRSIPRRFVLPIAAASKLQVVGMRIYAAASQQFLLRPSLGHLPAFENQNPGGVAMVEAGARR